MAEPNIVIHLGVDVEPAVEQVRNFAQQSKQYLQEAFATNADKFAANIYALTSKQQQLNAVIKETTARMEELRQKSETVNAGEKQMIDQEIAALGKLNDQHRQEILSIEEKRLKLEAKGKAAVASSDAEKLAIQLVTQNRLIENAILKDIQKSQQAIRDTAAEASAKQTAAVDQINRKQKESQTVLDQYKQKLVDIAAFQRTAGSEVDVALNTEEEETKKLIATKQGEVLALEAKKAQIIEQQALLAASSEQQIQAAKAATDAKLTDIATTQDQIRVQQAVDKALNANAAAAESATARRITALEELNRQEQQHQAIIAQDTQKLAELQAKRETASGEDLKRLNLESEALRKIIANHQQEIYEIQQKKIALDEEAQLALATTEKERDGIRAATDQRLAEIGVIRDQARAQNAVTEAVKEGSNAMADLARQFAGALGWATGIGAVVQVFRELDSIIVQTRNDIIAAEEAAQKFRDLGADIFDKSKSLFNEMGITDPKEQQAALAAINAISVNTGVTPSAISSTGATLAPSLKAQGITSITDPRFAEIVGQAAIVQDKGISADNIRDFVAQNPNATGQQINQAFSNLAANTGSPAMANAFEDAWQQNKAVAQTANFTQDDAEKLFVQLKNTRGISPREVPEIMGRFFSASQRMHGLNKDQQRDLLMKLAEDGQGVQPVREVIEKALNGPADAQIDIQQFAQAASKLSPADQSLVDRDVAGPRGVTALMSGAGYQGVQLSTNAPLFTPQTNPDALAAAEKERAQVDSSSSEPSVEGGSYVDQRQKQELESMRKRPDLYGGLNAKFGEGAIDENAWLNVQGKLLFEGAQLLASGKLPATAQAQLQKRMRYLANQLTASGSMSQRDQQMIQALATGAGNLGPDIHKVDPFTGETIVEKGGAITRSDAIKQLTGPDELETFLQRAMPYDTSGWFAPSQKNLRALDDTATLEQQLRAQQPPATQPSKGSSPMSVNYHSRNVFYGYSYDSLGGQESFGNNLG